VPELINCGPCNVVLNIIKYLEKSFFNITVISIRKSNDFAFEEIFRDLLINDIIYLENYELKSSSLEKIILDNNINVIHSHGFYPDKLVASLKVKKLKKITTIHCMFYKDYPKEYGFLKGFIGAYLHTKLLKKADFQYIVGCSNSVEDYCNINLKLSKVLGIHNGVDPNKYFILSESQKVSRRIEMKLTGKKVFIFAGRFIKRKRVPELLIFFKNQSPKDSILLLLGDGPDRINCEKIFNDDNIVFLGQVPNPEKYYQVADFIISNSEAEGYPMSIIEATSCGCYALLSEIPPHREFINNNPKCASFINDLDLNYFNPPKFNKDTIENLSAKIMSEKYIEIYRD
ncbi:glycosyltransferase family 4 protein, partial [Acinetobacter ursingii]|uniref:glycosyltransferase family 4 protein n=1 Tax=Acinetobacter ursingii TaxID=108980 RepID=UPI00313B4A52